MATKTFESEFGKASNNYPEHRDKGGERSFVQKKLLRHAETRSSAVLLIKGEGALRGALESKIVGLQKTARYQVMEARFFKKNMQNRLLTVVRSFEHWKEEGPRARFVFQGRLL